MTIAARATGLSKHYGSGSAEVVALDGVDFEVVSGEFTAIMGPSGSGKSTLMHLLAALDSPTSGKVFIGDTDVASLKDTPLTELRRDRIGFIFQAFNLVPTLSAKENIVLPLAIANKKVDQEWFDQIVDVLGLGNRLNHKPSELSGGQQQRVACARALMNRPDIIFGDEPTGNLDSASAAEVLGFLRRSVDEFGQTIVMVTHDALSASYADRQVFLSDGRIIKEVRGASQDELLSTMAIIYPRHDQKVEEPVAEATQDDVSDAAVTADAEDSDTFLDATSEATVTADDESMMDEILNDQSQDTIVDETDGIAPGENAEDAERTVDAADVNDGDVNQDDVSLPEESMADASEISHVDSGHDGVSSLDESSTHDDSEVEPFGDDVAEPLDDEVNTDAIFRDGGGAPEPEHLDENSETVMEQTIPRRAIAG